MCVCPVVSRSMAGFFMLACECVLVNGSAECQSMVMCGGVQNTALHVPISEQYTTFTTPEELSLHAIVSLDKIYYVCVCVCVYYST